jgi:hypothetical protein
MKKTLNGLAIICLIFFVGAASQNTIYEFENNYHADVKNSTEEFKVKPGQKLELDFNTGASISVTGWNKDLVKVEVSIEGKDAEDVVVEYEETANGLEITTEYRNRKNNHKSDVEFTIYTPQKFDLEFLTMGGSVELKNLEGELTGKTMGGQLSLSELKGEIDLTTMGGNIALSGSEVDGRLETMGGNIAMKNVVGNVDAKTMGGNISQSNVKGRTGSDELSISTMGGNITIDDAPNGANVKTMGGNISVQSAEDFVIAETMGGNINIVKVEGKVEAKTMGGAVSAKIIKNDAINQDVYLTSMGGDIQLNVPADFDMEIDIEIRYEDENDDVDIKSDFKINEKVSESRGDYILKGTAIVGNGKNKVKIRTINSEVIIKKI